MKPVIFRGCGCALVTPMTQEGKIRYDVFEKLIEYQIKNQTAALIVCGSTGESASLTDVEYASCIRFAVETSAGRVPIIAGSGGPSTLKTIERSRMAEELGADALLVVTPAYSRPPQEGLTRHFSAVADAANVPVVLYNVPSRTACSLAPETLRILAEHPRIAAVKEADRDLGSLLKTRSFCKDLLAVYAGNDDLIAPCFSLGAIGAISVAANLCPKEMALLCQAGLDGEFSVLTKRQIAVSPLLDALSCAVNPIPIKEALNLAGLPVGPCRIPLTPLSRDQRNVLYEMIEKLGIRKEWFE